MARVAAFPGRLQVRNALSGAELGVLPLGERSVRLYGAPYATIHRADLHRLLLEALEQRSDVRLGLGSWVVNFRETPHAVTLTTTEGLEVEADVLVGADGLWSRVRELMLNDGAPRVPGHLAYRAMVPQASLPERLRSQQVTAWLGPRLHVVQYPVRRGEWLNVVAIVQGQVDGDLHSWDHGANAADLRKAMGHTCPPLQDLIAAIPDWRLWALCDRPPMKGAWQQAQGRVALLGDAAHPMRPYLAQGAGMAIEDARRTGSVAGPGLRCPWASACSTMRRTGGNAVPGSRRVPSAMARSSTRMDWSAGAGMPTLKLLGERVLDVPWLYAGP